MKSIDICENGIGNLRVSCINNIPIENEYAIKSLARIQMLLMISPGDKKKNKQLISILKESIDKISDIWIR